MVERVSLATVPVVAWKLYLKDEGRNRNAAEHVDLQVVCSHRQAGGCSQSFVLAFACCFGVLSARRLWRKLCELLTVKVIAVQPIEVLLLSSINDLIQAASDLGLLFWTTRGLFGCGRG